MSLLKFKLIAFSGLVFSQIAHADLAQALNCHEKIEEKTCSALLIGQIDALKTMKHYCPDGQTSYGFIQQAWARELRKDSALASQDTSISLKKTIVKLGLDCKN